MSIMHENRKDAKLFVDGDGNTWNEDGEFVLDETADPIMDFVNRIGEGEDIEAAQAASEKKRAEREAKIAEAKRTGTRIPL